MLPATNSRRSFDFAVRPKLLEVGPQISDVFLVPDGNNHSRPGNFRGRVWHELLERGLAPDEARILEGITVVKSLDGPSTASIEAVEDGAKLILRSLADGMTDCANAVENVLACRNLLCCSPGRRS